MVMGIQIHLVEILVVARMFLVVMVLGPGVASFLGNASGLAVAE